LALLDLIRARRRPQREFVVPTDQELKPLPEPAKPLPEQARMTLIRQFLRVSNESAAAAGAFVACCERDTWFWGVYVSSDTNHTWSDEPGDDWRIVDPATGDQTYRDLSDVETEMEWPWFSAVLALLSSVPWLWYFLLARLRELSEAQLGRVQVTELGELTDDGS
jgi:hypothetical protein